MDKNKSKPKLFIRRGDKVQVIAGKNKGEVGKILRIDRDKMRVFVEGINIQKKHAKPTRANQSGGIREIEGPVHYSNVLLYSSKSQKGERIKIVADKSGNNKRKFVKSDVFVD